MNFLQEIFLGREKIFTRNVALLHAALILISFLFVYILSYSTSFRYSLLGMDSPIFQVIGKYWAQGYLPYVALFDHKGPLIFLVNALGYAIYPRSGIMVPQIIFLYVSSLFFWRAIELHWRGGAKILLFLLTLLYYYAHYWEGNNSGEYTMPFLAASTYCFLRYLKDGGNFCPPLYGFIYGLSFGGCVLVRASNAMPTCCYAFLTLIFLLQARAFKDLWRNVLSFCAGFAAIVLPFVIYFAAHDALGEALYGTLIFNTQYAIQGKIEYPLAERLEYIVFKFMPLVLIILFGAILAARETKNKLAWSGIFIGVMTAALLLNLRLYIHYYMIVVPIIPVLCAILKRLRETDKQFLNSVRRTVVYTAMIICAATYAAYCSLIYLSRLPVYFNRLAISAHEEMYREEVIGARRLQSLIPLEERRSFACWGDFCTTSHWILETDMLPRERFFMNNASLSLLDTRLKEEWLADVRRDSTLWILYGTNAYEKETYRPDEHRRDPDVERLLAEHYTLRGETKIYDQILKLYRLKD